MKKSVLNFLSKAAINNRNIACILFLAFLLGGSNSLLFAQKVKKETFFSIGQRAEKDSNYAKARTNYHASADKEKNKEAQYLYAFFCETGVGGDTNYKDAINYYTKASEKGFDEATFRLARMYEYGLGMDNPNTELAEKLYKKVKKMARARIQLGDIYLNRKNYKQALAHYVEAYSSAIAIKDIEQQSIASYKKGIVHIRRNDVSDETKEGLLSHAINFFEESWAGGYVDAAIALGQIYLGTYGGGRDETIAFDYFRQASQRGNAKGAFMVGYMYEHGKGVQQDWRSAVKSYQQAQRFGYDIVDLQPQIDSLYKLIEKEKDGRAQVRCALIVANGGYNQENGFGPLKKPIMDAFALKNSLTKLGFDKKNVLIASNQDKGAEEKIIEQFGTFSETCDMSLFFYSGHAVQVEGKSYIMPPKAKKTGNVYDEGINVETIIGHMNKGDAKKTKIVILEACRTPNSSTYASVYGILPVPQGFFLAYSTQPGESSLEGDENEKNSPYMTALLETLKEPGLKITDLFAKVKEYVKRETKGEQCPVTYNALYNDNFIFNLGSSK